MLRIRRTFASVNGAKERPIFEHTVNLPRTDFPMRAKAAQNELKYRDVCTEKLYQWQQITRKDATVFRLHDGPPYANGDLHIGHALNKILKDIINRYQLLRGKLIEYRPGWDCHGLPIELKAQHLLKSVKDPSPLQIRNNAAKFAISTVNSQREQFKSWGIMGEWERPYRTLDPEYEANQLLVFQDMFKQGLIYQKFRPVYWSPSSRTALAEAELEYVDNHKSRSAYVKMRVDNGAFDTPVYALIWTTTPWTLPANRAISVNPELQYVIIKPSNSEASFIVAKNLQESVQRFFESGTSFEIVKELSGKELANLTYQHPLYKDRTGLPFLMGSHVTDDSGTGLVHTAPGHGFEDYDACRSNPDIEIACPVDERGNFTSEAGTELSGLNIFKEGSDKVIEMLGDSLLAEETYVHKYPYDWRTKKPVIIRATKQWFADISAIRNDLVSILNENVEMVPESGTKRLISYLSNRSEWCISRQRSWGVPIPVFYHVKSSEPLVNEEIISHIANLVREHGTDCWFELNERQLMPKSIPDSLVSEYRKGSDTLDVWFDSGVSWKTVCGNNEIADLYLEGSDQHRGWFQSSLITSVASRNKAPYKKVITHGFVTDESGKKMSKSLGNVIDPSYVTKEGKDPKTKKMNLGYGVDVMRMWIASSDYTRDVSIGPNIIKNVAESLRKIRNTTRFILGNLYDFDPEQAMVHYDKMQPIDKYMLAKLSSTMDTVHEGYETFDFAKSYSSLTHFSSTDLSAFYFDIVKHSLFNDAATSLERRSSQTAMFHILRNLMLLTSPFAPHFAEEVFEHYRKISTKDQRHFSVFQLGWPETPAEWVNEDILKDWDSMRKMRDLVNVELERIRQEKLIGSSLQANVTIKLGKRSSILEKYDEDTLAKFMIVPTCSVTVENEQEPAVDDDIIVKEIKATKSTNHRCPRCRSHLSISEDQLCARCSDVILTDFKESPKAATA